jgi:hypothetical protein
MLGLFPYKLPTNLNQNAEPITDKALPPMKLRNSKSSRLDSTIDGYTMLPVFNYIKPNIYDDISWQGCGYAAGNRKYKYDREQSYQDVSPYVLEVMKDPIKASFNLTPSDAANMVYTDFYNYSDILISEKFEGARARYRYSELQWTLIRNSQEVLLVNCFDAGVRTLWITKHLRTAVQALQDTVGKLLNGTRTDDDLRYIVHSSHDTQQWNIVKFLEPVGYEPIDMPYASTVIFELHYDEGCLADPKKRGEHCFSVPVFNNGDMLKLDTCLQDNNLDIARIANPICTFQSFVKHFEKLMFKGDLIQKCESKFIPPSSLTTTPSADEANFLK